MKRKIIALCLIVAMLGVAVIGGTMAYFTDSAEAVNVMTIGSVKIEQHEYERVVDANGQYVMVKSEKYNAEGYKLQEFTQAKPLVPAVGEIKGYGTPVYFDQLGKGASGGQQVLDGLNNVVDKFVLVENTGRSDAYVRTIIAFEIGTCENAMFAGDKYDANGNKIPQLIMTSSADDAVWLQNDIGAVEIDGNDYYVVEYVYAGSDTRHVGGILPAGEFTYNNLAQLYLRKEATNEDAEKIDGNKNGTYDILVLSQAVQASGFESAEKALDEAFGDVTAAKVKEWFDKTEIPVVVNTAKELEKALNSATEGTTSIALGNDITGDMTVVQNPDAKVVVDGNGYKYTGDIVVNGGSGNTNTETGLVIQNVNFYAAKASDVEGDAFIKLGVSGNNNTRYVKNVTVSNCTFDVGVNDKDLVAIKSYTGGDKNLTIENCTVSERIHSLLQVKNVEEKLTIIDCTIKSKNGVNVESTTNIDIIGCNFDVRGYAVRFGVNSGGNPTEAKNFLLKNNVMKSLCQEADDAVIIFRASAVNATLTMEGNTIEGTPEMIGNTSATTIIKK